MKLAKLSLATLIALGAVSTASATSLEEAIKNVDLTGFARYRYNHENGKALGNEGKGHSTRHHQFRMITNFKATYDDNFYGVLGLRYTSNDGSGTGSDATNTTNPFNVHQFYLGYKAANTEVKLGKQVVGSFLTDDLVATGALVLNSDLPGLTLVAFAFDALESSSFNDGGLWDQAGKKGTIGIDYGNLYGAAVLGNYDPVAFQLWYADFTRVTKVAALELSGNLEVADGVSINAKGQYAHSKPNKDSKNTFGKTDFYAFELGSEFFGAEVNAGYVGWKVKKNKLGGNGTGIISFEDQGNYIDLGEQISGDVNDYTWLKGKGNFLFLKAGYTFAEQYFVGADYINGKVKVEDDKTKYKEFVLRGGYDYSKKLKFNTFYSHLKEKPQDGQKESKTKVRFEAKYSF